VTNISCDSSTNQVRTIVIKWKLIYDVSSILFFCTDKANEHILFFLLFIFQSHLKWYVCFQYQIKLIVKPMRLVYFCNDKEYWYIVFFEFDSRLLESVLSTENFETWIHDRLQQFLSYRKTHCLFFRLIMQVTKMSLMFVFTI
jgi:hypothetical protein